MDIPPSSRTLAEVGVGYVLKDAKTDHAERRMADIFLWATLAFACGTMVIFIFLHRFVARRHSAEDRCVAGRRGRCP